MLATQNPKLAIVIFTLAALGTPVVLILLGVEAILWLREWYPYIYRRHDWGYVGLGAVGVLVGLMSIAFLFVMSVRAIRQSAWLEYGRWSRYWRNILWGYLIYLLLIILWCSVVMVATFPL